MNKEEFDRSVCFTLFNDYHEQIMRVKEAYGPEKAFEVYEAIANYGLYEEEIKDPWLMLLVGASLLKNIDNSQRKRSLCFAGEDLEMSKKIILLHMEHPEYSQNKISQVLNTSKGKVNKTLQKYKNGGYNSILDLGNPILNSNPNANPYRGAGTTEHNTYIDVTTTEPMTDFAGTTKYDSLDDVPTDVIYEIYDFYQQGKDYNYISRNTGLTNDQIGAIIEDGMSYRFTAPEDRPFS